MTSPPATGGGGQEFITTGNCPKCGALAAIRVGPTGFECVRCTAFPYKVAAGDGSGRWSGVDGPSVQRRWPAGALVNAHDWCQDCNAAYRAGQKSAPQPPAGVRALLAEAIRPGVFGEPFDTPHDPRFDGTPLLELCERYGYGAVMSQAAHLWRMKAKVPIGGEFTLGACAAVRRDWNARARAALADGGKGGADGR